MVSAAVRQSVFGLLELPNDFGVVLLILTLILALVPYLSGKDFGIFKVPPFSIRARRVLLVVGPVAFASVIFLFVPLFKVDPLAAPRKVRKVLHVVQSFTDFQADTASVEEAERILRYARLRNISVSSGRAYATAQIDLEWTITIWPQTHKKPKAYGIRYNNRDPSWDWERTYFEIVIPGDR